MSLIESIKSKLVRKRESAAETYRRLLRKSHNGGLSADEQSQLEQAVDDAEISLEQVEADESALSEIRTLTEAASRLAETQKAAAASAATFQKHHAAVEAEIAAHKAKLAKLTDVAASAEIAAVGAENDHSEVLRSENLRRLAVEKHAVLLGVEQRPAMMLRADGTEDLFTTYDRQHAADTPYRVWASRYSESPNAAESRKRAEIHARFH